MKKSLLILIFSNLFLLLIPIAMADAVTITVNVEDYVGQIAFNALTLGVGGILIGGGTILWLMRGFMFEGEGTVDWMKLAIAGVVGVSFVAASWGYLVTL